MATGLERGATLVAVDDPDRLDWRGRSNLYHGIVTYLQPSREGPDDATIHDFASWSDDPRGLREVDSVEADGPVWASADPFGLIARADPSASFALEAGERPLRDQGARRGPFGPILIASDALALGPKAAPAGPVGPPRPAILGGPPANPNREPGKTVAAGPLVSLPSGPMPAETAAPKADPPKAMARDDDPPVEPMAPMERDPAEGPPPALDEKPGPPPVVADPPVKERANPPDLEALRTADALIDALNRPASKGGVLKIAGGADLAVSSIEIRGPGRWVLQAEPGAPWPVLRFKPGAPDPERPAERPSLFRVRSGSLELRGIDLVLDDADAPADGAWAPSRSGPGPS